MNKEVLAELANAPFMLGFWPYTALMYVYELFEHSLCVLVLVLSLSLYLPFSDSHPYVSSLVCAFFMSLTPVWMIISSKHPASRQLLYSGWEPVITAMVISRSPTHTFSCTKLDKFAHIYSSTARSQFLMFVFFPISIGGLILDKTVSDPNLAGIVVYTPVINGKTSSFWIPASSLEVNFPKIFTFNFWFSTHFAHFHLQAGSQHMTPAVLLFSICNLSA